MNVNLFALDQWLMRKLVLKLEWSCKLFCASFVAFWTSQMKLVGTGTGFMLGDDNKVVEELIELEMMNFWWKMKE